MLIKVENVLKVVLIFIVILIITVPIGAYFFLPKIKLKSIDKNASRVVNQTEDFFERREKEISILSENPIIKASIMQLKLGEGYKQVNEVISGYKNIYPYIKRVTILDISGAPIFSTDEGDFKNIKPHHIDPENEVFFTDIYYNNFYNLYTTTIIKNLRNMLQQTKGYLLIDTGIKELSDSYKKMSRGMIVFVLNENGKRGLRLPLIDKRVDINDTETKKIIQKGTENEVFNVYINGMLYYSQRIKSKKLPWTFVVSYPVVNMIINPVLVLLYILLLILGLAIFSFIIILKKKEKFVHSVKELKRIAGEAIDFVKKSESEAIKAKDTANSSKKYSEKLKHLLKGTPVLFRNKQKQESDGLILKKKKEDFKFKMIKPHK